MSALKNITSAKRAKRLLYGKIFHYLIEHFLKTRKWINTYDEFRDFIFERIRKDFYLVQKSEIDKREFEEILRSWWSRYANKKPSNLILMLIRALERGYKIKTEYPIITYDPKSKKTKTYIVDVLLYHPLKKKAFVVEIKTGTKRRRKSSSRQTINYAKKLKSVPFFSDYSVSSYIYWYRYDEFEKPQK